MSRLPEKLSELIEFFDLLSDRSERIEALTSLADRLESVPERIGRRPYPESNRVPECESQAYVWSEELKGQTLKYYIAIENPQGIAAKAAAAVLTETLSGTPLEEIGSVPKDIMLSFFGEELSLRKRLGLAALVERVKFLARKHLEALYR